MVSHELSERSRRLLAALVREYIATGEPVPSQTLARESGLGVSSATIRNLFARLEADGYVHQPHTSAGRVPTDRGYRVFVDLLLESRKPTRPTAIVEHELRQHAERSPLIDDLLISVSHMVSRASKHVGFAIGRHRDRRPAAHRICSARRDPRARGRRLKRQSGHAEGRRCGRRHSLRRSGRGGQLSQYRIWRACRSSTSARPSSRGWRRSGRCMTS